MFESTFQREATHRKERTKPPRKAMGTPVPLECDLERCSLESTRNHLDSVESSDSPPARDGVTQNGAEGNAGKEGDSHRLPPPRALCPSMRRGSAVGVSQWQAFPMVPIINLLASRPPRKELAAAPMAQRDAICQKGCTRRLLPLHPLGLTWGAAARLGGRNRQMCSGCPGRTSSPQGSPEAQSCHPVSSSGQGITSMSSLLPPPSPKDAKGQHHHFIQPTAMSLQRSGAPGTPGSLPNKLGSPPNLTPAAHPREGPITAAQEVLCALGTASHPPKEDSDAAGASVSAAAQGSFHAQWSRLHCPTNTHTWTTGHRPRGARRPSKFPFQVLLRQDSPRARTRPPAALETCAAPASLGPLAEAPAPGTHVLKAAPVLVAVGRTGRRCSATGRCPGNFRWGPRAPRALPGAGSGPGGSTTRRPPRAPRSLPSAG